MSLASDYAAAVVQDQSVAPPAPFVGPSGRMEVTAAGNLRIVPNTAGVNQEIPANGVLSIRDWMTTTFG